MLQRITNFERTMLLLTMNGGHYRVVIATALCCSLFVVPSLSPAQNLVPNPSFELIDSCPQFPVLLGFQTGAIPQYWFSASDTPDYYNACVDTISGVPSNFMTYQPAFDGDAYVGMYTYTSIMEFREMVGVELVDPLVVGQTYYASFYANAAFGGEISWPTRATNNMGLLFTMNPYVWVFPMPPFQLRDLAHVRSTDVISDTVGWTLVSGSFVADSAYRYMVIGNHYGDAQSMLEVLDADTAMGQYFAYTLIDGLCVSTDPMGCPMATGTDEHREAGLRLFPNPARDELWIDLGRMDSGLLLVTDAIGRVIWQDEAKGERSMRLDLAGWAAGQYVLSVVTAKEKHWLKFVVL